METFKQIKKDTNLTGLAVYTVTNVWHVDQENKTFYFGAIGVNVSARYYDKKEYTEADGTTFLNKSHWNKFVINVEYDYRNTENLHSLEYQKSGTFGKTLFSDTIEEGIKKAELFLNDSFEGVLNFKGETQVPILKISRLELAKISNLHSLAMFNTFKNDDFRLKKINSQPNTLKELKELIKRCKNREEAHKKYTDKIKKVFLSVFGFDLKTCSGHTRFSLRSFEKKMNLKLTKNQPLKDVLTKKQLNTLQHTMKAFNY